MSTSKKLRFNKPKPKCKIGVTGSPGHQFASLAVAMVSPPDGGGPFAKMSPDIRETIAVQIVDTLKNGAAASATETVISRLLVKQASP